MTRLPSDISEALQKSDDDLRVIDPATEKVYVLIDHETHRRAMDALRQQSDLDAIREGVAQADSGETISAEELKAGIRSRFGFQV